MTGFFEQVLRLAHEMGAPRVGRVALDGSKIKAAAALGMSRATIYRKIHEYGIVAPAK